MNEKQQGLLALTRAVLERAFSNARVAKLTDEHMKVLGGIVFHHLLCNLSAHDMDVLAQMFCDANTIEAIGDETGVPLKRLRQVEREALIRLAQAAQLDLAKVMNVIESDKEQS